MQQLITAAIDGMEPLKVTYQEQPTRVANQQLLSVDRFHLLCIATFGLYEIWWIYKSWKFFKEREGLDIYPAVRAILSIFFLNSLLEKIRQFSTKAGYTPNYTPSTVTIIYIFGNIIFSRLPDPFWIIGIAMYLVLVPPFKALNWALANAPEYQAQERPGFSDRQLVLLIVGCVLWALILLGMMME